MQPEFASSRIHDRIQLRERIAAARAYRFVVISGVGWICDLTVFELLVQVAHLSSRDANFISCYAGLTLVYFASLRFVFSKFQNRRSRYLLFYWGFQFFSIIAYSFVVGRLSLALNELDLIHPGLRLSGFTAKVTVTPMNLLTNFTFMRYLVTLLPDIPEA